MEMLDSILPILSLALVGVLGVFVLFGMLFGLIRGVKRAGLRLAIFGGLLVVVFFLTPVISNALLGMNVNIGGRTPNGHVDAMADTVMESLQSSLGKYVAPFGPYLREYAVGIVLAAVNLVLFIVLYLVVKVLSWIIYAIVAHFAAPKRDKDGNKLPRHRGWGLLVGAVQGVFLFLFFMMPINGMLGIVNQAATYQAAQAKADAQALRAADYYVGTNDGYDTDSSSDSVDLDTVFADVNGAMGLYNNVLKYTGLQFLSKQAFSYQLTVRVEGSQSINLVHDINSAWELYVDLEKVTAVLDKIAAVGDTYDLTTITAADYQVLRNYINKTFDLQILHIADRIFTDLDKIFNTPFADDDSLLAGTNIHADSIYGSIIKQNVTARELADDANRYELFGQGLRAAVKFLSKEKLDLVRHDLLAVIDFAETLGSYEFTYDGLTAADDANKPATVTVAQMLAQDNFGWRDAVNLLTARLAKNYGKQKTGTSFIKVFGNRLGQFSMVKLLSQPHIENLVVYSNWFDADTEEELESYAGDDSEQIAEVRAMVRDLAELFLGEKAQATWNKVGKLVTTGATVARDNAEFIDEVVRLFQDKNTEQADMLSAIIEKLDLLIVADAEGDAKYQKVNRLAGVIYDTLDLLAPVKTFAVDYLQKMGEDNEMFASLADVLNKSRDEWISTVRGLVSAAKLVNDPVIKDFMKKFQGEEAGDLSQEDLAELLDTVVNGMTAEDVSSLLETVLDVDGIGETVKDALGSAVDGILDQLENGDLDLDEIFGEEDAAIIEQALSDLSDYLNGEEDAAELGEIIGELWDTITESQAFQDFLDDLKNNRDNL